MRNGFLLLFALTVVCIITQSAFALPQQECEGIEVLYPKTDSIIDRGDDQSSTYLILGNTGSISTKLLRVVLLHSNNEKEISKDVWSGQDELLKVSAIQQDLTKLEKKDLPNTFWFRVLVEQEGNQCQYESGRFKIKI